MRALTDDGDDLAATAEFGRRVVAHFGDALETPDKLRDGLRGGAKMVGALGTAALNALPGPAVGALPQMLGVLASRASGGLEGLVEKGIERVLAQLPPSPVPDPPPLPRDSAEEPPREEPAADARVGPDDDLAAPEAKP